MNEGNCIVLFRHPLVMYRERYPPLYNYLNSRYCFIPASINCKYMRCSYMGRFYSLCGAADVTLDWEVLWSVRSSVLGRLCILRILWTLSTILCKWKQDSVVNFLLYLYSVFKNKHKLVHNQSPVMNRLCPFLFNFHQ